MLLVFVLPVGFLFCRKVVNLKRLPLILSFTNLSARFHGTVHMNTSRKQPPKQITADTQALKYFSLAYGRCFVLQYRTVCVHSFRLLFHVVSQVKSAPTPAGEPNVRAEAEKKKKCQKRYNLLHLSYMEQKSRKHGKRESHRAALLATASQLPKALYLQTVPCGNRK